MTNVLSTFLPASIPLNGVTVIEIGSSMGVAYAGLLLALSGAKVIRVDSADKSEEDLSNHNVQNKILRANKESVSLDTRTPDGQNLLEAMITRADVLIHDGSLEDTRPNRFDIFKLGARSSRLISARCTASGRDEDYGWLANSDIVVQAMMGMMSTTGYPINPPVKAGPAAAEFFAGAHLFGAVVTALVRREREGRGASVDISMMESIYAPLMSNVCYVLARGAHPNEREGNRNAVQASVPYNIYRTKTGYVAIRVTTDEHWRLLVSLLDDDGISIPSGLEDMAARVLSVDLVDDVVQMWTTSRTTDEVFAMLRLTGVPCGPVRSLSDVLDDAYFAERGMIAKVDCEGETIPFVQSPLLFEGEDRVSLRPPPETGRDNEEIFIRWLGLNEQELADLLNKGII